MLYYKNNQFHICPYIAHYMARGQRQFKYTCDKEQWTNFVNRWWHHKDLEFTPVNPTQAQLDRLQEINDAGIKQGFKSGASMYVESGLLPKDEDGNVEPPFDQFTENPDASNSMLQTEYELAIEDLMEKKAKEKNYRSPNRLMLYTSSKKQKWKGEAATFIEWRDDVFAYCYQAMEDIINQKREVPTVQEFLNELPKLQWP